MFVIFNFAEDGLVFEGLACLVEERRFLRYIQLFLLGTKSDN